MANTRQPKNEEKLSGKAFDIVVFRRILGYAKAYRRQFAITSLTAIVLSFLGTARPIILIEVVNTYVAPRHKEGLLFLILIMLALLLLEVMMQFVFVYLANWLGQHIIRDIRKELFHHILHFKMAYIDTSSVGRLVTRVVSDLETIASFFSQGLFMIVGDLLKIFVIIGVMLIINWRLALIAFAVLPILIYATKLFQQGIKRTFQEVRKQVARLNSFVQERINGMSLIQLFTREKLEYQKFKTINSKYKKAYIKAIWYYSIFFPVAEVLSSIAIGLIVWYGGLQALTNNSIQPGEIIGFIMMAQMLFRPLRQIADKFNTLQMGIVAGERIFILLDTDSRTPRTGALSANSIKGAIQFDKVHFSYVPGEKVLKSISFKIKPGETIAIVGATGAGKSTIVNLINRFYDIEKGHIRIDGIDIKEYELTSLRNQIAVVLQDVFLFSDSILHNINLKDERIDLDTVIAAAKKIGIDKFINELALSGREHCPALFHIVIVIARQLIAFLRAYVSHPSILILDEATSSIDSHSEQLLQQATEKITQNCTSIIIAHRLATIKKADKILVMDQGKIVEQGTHKELLNKSGGFYKNLHDKQFAMALE